ncbi:MAG: LuxR C-terminal-related transcriptional regulator, partial [Gaiellaceae bacterium]
DVAAALVAGPDTRAVTQRLFISPHAVQDHLKSMFDKIGIHSRRQQLARERCGRRFGFRFCTRGSARLGVWSAAEVG